MKKILTPPLVLIGAFVVSPVKFARAVRRAWSKTRSRSRARQQDADRREDR